MGKDFSGLAQLALASGALVIPACKTASGPTGDAERAVLARDSTPPSIVTASVDHGVLQLRFSEAIAPAETIDPSKFRLTFGYYEAAADSDSYYYYASYYSAARAARTWYTDVGHFFPEGTPLRQTAANTIQVPLPADLNVQWVCDDIVRMQKRGAVENAGLYLHYAESGGPAIADVRGNRLRSIAPYWLSAQSSTVAGKFANKPIPVRLSCG